MEIEYLLTQIPLTPEELILVLRICGVIAGLLVIRCLYRAISLNTSLSVTKAQAFIFAEINFTAPQITEQTMPPLEVHPKEEPAKPKRPLLYATISADARMLLDKISVDISFDDGWCGMSNGIRRNEL